MKKLFTDGSGVVGYIAIVGPEEYTFIPSTAAIAKSSDALIKALNLREYPPLEAGTLVYIGCTRYTLGTLDERFVLIDSALNVIDLKVKYGADEATFTRSVRHALNWNGNITIKYKGEPW